MRTLSLLCAKSTPSVCKQNKQKTPHKKHERITSFVSAQHRERRFLLLFVVVVILMCVRACVRVCVCVLVVVICCCFQGGWGLLVFVLLCFVCLFVEKGDGYLQSKMFLRDAVLHCKLSE